MLVEYAFVCEAGVLMVLTTMCIVLICHAAVHPVDVAEGIMYSDCLSVCMYV